MSDSLLDSYDALLLDLDGTVYHGVNVIPGAAEVLETARERDVPVRFVTNNASKAPVAVAEHLRALGVAGVPSEVNTSAQAAAGVLRDRVAVGETVLVVGTDSLAAEVAAVGLKPVRTVRAGREGIAAVVQGHSPDTGWADLAEACLAIRAGALWVACNADVTLPAERGLLPGNGAMVAALRAATGTEPAVAGKPQTPLFETAAGSAGASRPLVVGDRLDTDIAGAVAAGMDALVVLTGVATPATLLAAVPAERARYLAADLSALTEPAELLAIGPQPGWQVHAEDGALVATGDGAADATALLRVLCGVAWQTGVTTVRASGDHAAAALVELALT
ncbi:HAD-IIA family hydrolase [Amycolatopsis nigrescens]|uniref:HAD-IIA family hydrolase n=1 Tax=Amycolatopsis nigrescens TaxID=381445 RepID=UPI00037CD143|nr:HAD-IIA family hydrolase [Amycolatopsis nigrescens]